MSAASSSSSKTVTQSRSARQAQGAGQELPGVLDRLALEVVAETEVAEHLEERVVARRVADVLEIVVLAAGAHAALRRRGALVAAFLVAEEHVLELHHAGVREQQRRVVAGHQRRARDDLVAVVTKKLQECLAQLIARHGFHRRDIGVVPSRSNPLVYGVCAAGLRLNRLRRSTAA